MEVVTKPGPLKISNTEGQCFLVDVDLPILGKANVPVHSMYYRLYEAVEHARAVPIPSSRLLGLIEQVHDWIEFWGPHAPVPWSDSRFVPAAFQTPRLHDVYLLTKTFLERAGDGPEYDWTDHLEAMAAARRMQCFVEDILSATREALAGKMGED